MELLETGVSRSTGLDGSKDYEIKGSDLGNGQLSGIHVREFDHAMFDISIFGDVGRG